MTTTIERPTFMARVSNLDIHSRGSNLSQAGYDGWLNLIAIIGTFTVLWHNAYALEATGALIGVGSFVDLVSRWDIFPALGALVSSSFLAPLLHHWVTPLGLRASYAAHSLALSTVFVLANLVVLARQWPVIQSAVFLLEMLILLMKMHSYMVVTRSLYFHPTTSPYRIDGLSDTDGKLTAFNFLWYLAAPTLIYELSYPRTASIRPSYFIGKVFTFVACVAYMHVIAELYVNPVLIRSAHSSLANSVADLILPIMGCGLLFFYILFDVICNGFAELTRFADRRFYDDWWNSTTFDEYARKWNRPVHQWLRRHVYMSSIESFRASRTRAAFLTFFVSSVLHEYYLGMVFGIFRPWIFLLQMFQLPLIFLMKGLRGTRLGNVVFWFGLSIGVPLIATVYTREYYLNKINGIPARDSTLLEMFALLVLMPLCLLGILLITVHWTHHYFSAASNHSIPTTPLKKKKTK